MRRWIDVATLTKTRSLNGRFVARCAAGLSFMPEPGMRVDFAPPQTDLPRSARVVEARWIDDVLYEVAFDEIADERTAGELVGCHCLVERSCLPPRAFEEPSRAWTGWEVVDASRGVIGKVASVTENPAQDLLEVALPGRRRPLLVPMVEEFFEGVDVEGRTVHLDVPEGLWEL